MEATTKNVGGRPRKFKKGTAMTNITVAKDDAGFLKLLSVRLNQEPELKAQLEASIGLQ